MTDATHEQKRVWGLIDEGKDVLVCGLAGSGKSSAVQMKCYDRMKKGERVKCTAPTGVIASSFGGQTLHSLLCMKPDSKTVDIEKVMPSLANTDILVVEEAGMMGETLLNILYFCLESIESRMGRRPQLILVGDPLQTSSPFGGRFYESDAWKSHSIASIRLTNCLRHKSREFYALLSDVGLRGDISSFEKLLTITSQRPYKDQIWMCATNDEVDLINRNKLRQHNGLPIVLDAKAVTRFGNSKDTRKSSYVKEEIYIKIGMTIMTLINNPLEGYMNGSIGILRDYDSWNEVLLIELGNGKVVRVRPSRCLPNDSRFQFPVRAAFAATIDKLQGLTLCKANLKCNECFQAGSAYSAITRVRNPEDMFIFPEIWKKNIKVDEKAKEFYERIPKAS